MTTQEIKEQYPKCFNKIRLWLFEKDNVLMTEIETNLENEMRLTNKF